MLVIPTSALASQILQTQPADQPLTLSLYQKTTGLYCDIAISTVPLLYGILCRDRVRLVRDTYWGFTGDLQFVDTQGATDPSYDGLGTRWFLLWFAASEVVAGT
jgi:hypothetical protein